MQAYIPINMRKHGNLLPLQHRWKKNRNLPNYTQHKISHEFSIADNVQVETKLIPSPSCSNITGKT